MHIKWLCIVSILLAGLYQQGGYSQETSAPPAQSGNLEAGLTSQQKINRAVLLESANDQLRVEAAIELLLSGDKLTRQVLIEALKQNDNAAAQAAVCKALAQSRTLLTVVHNKEDFIEPLFNILLAQPDVPAKLAAEALVIFDYKKVEGRLEKTSKDDAADISARLHAIYALKLRSDDQAATVTLIRLLDNKNKQVADAAALALQDSLGIPVGTEPKVWEQIAKEVAGKSHDEFIRDRLLQQMVRVRQLEANVKRWQTLTIAAMDSLYKGMSDDSAKTAFLTERLSGDDTELQLWAIRRVSEWRMGNKPLPQTFGPVLLSLISANDPVVRLETAKLLALTSYLGPAPALLKQLQVEKDEEVKTQLFVALGQACNYAYEFKSDVNVPSEVQRTVRELAVKYLMDSDAKKAQKGAEVLGKLLTHNAVEKSDAQKYFSILVQRYDQAQADANSPLRAPLLDVMTGLCGQGAAYRAEAAEIFKPIFVQMLVEKENSVRESAVVGLIKIDGPHSLAMLVGKNLKDDPSETIRVDIMDLAGEIGGPNDLTWLESKINANGDGDVAWRAMAEIFKRCDSATLSEWISRFDADAKIKLAATRKAVLLEMTVQKAAGENSAAILGAVRKRLADFYYEQKQFDKAAKYYGILVETASGKERDDLLEMLLDTQLKAQQFNAAAQLVANRLLEKDLDADDIFVKKINSYLAGSADKAQNVSFVKSLAGIGSAEKRPKWRQQLAYWQRQAEPNEPRVVEAPEPNKVSAAAATPAKI